MLFRLTLVGLVWVAAAIAVELFTGRGGGTVLLVGVGLAFAGAIVVSVLKGRWLAGAVGILVVVVGFLIGDVGPGGLALAPLAMAGFLAPLLGATRSPRPDSLWIRRFPSD
jgi:hypothetical protein